MADTARSAEGKDPPVPASWDSVWVPWDPETGTGGYADWAMADSNENPRNSGGLKAQNPLATSIMLCLFTDRRRRDGKRRRDDMPANDGSLDDRGYHGDSYDVDTAAGERELGSLLWTLERERLTTQDLKLIEHYAADALQTLVDQGAVDHFEITAERDLLEPNRVNMLVKAFDRFGAPLFSGQYPLQ